MTNSVPKDVEIQKQLTAIHVDEWLREDLFRFRWWCLLVMLAAMVIIWWVLLDKSRLYETCLFVVLGVFVVLGILEYGEEMTLWNFPTDVIAIFPPLSSINVLCLPFLYSLVYQKYTALGSYTRAVLVITAVFSFIVEPLLSLCGFYQLILWNHFFSFILYTATALFLRTIVIVILAIASKHRHDNVQPDGRIRGNE